MKRVLVLVVALAVTAAACGDDSPTSGGDGTSADASSTAPRVIEVAMTDMAFAPASLDVTAGETVTFVFRNDGAVRHEALFGDLAAQEAHHAEMAETAEMGDDHDGMDMDSAPHDSMEMSDLHAVVVEPGETVEMSHTFDATGSTMIGCHEPGHWEAGMKMDVEVA